MVCPGGLIYFNPVRGNFLRVGRGGPGLKEVV